MRLRGKVALVTGSTTGIGEAIARRFASEGARVMVHGRPEAEAEAEAIVRAIEEGGEIRGGEAAYHLADLADPDACAGLIAAITARFGRIDILVNNAALTTRGNLETTDADAFDRIIAVNLRAPLLLIRAALPHFQKNGCGAVLNIGSVNAYCGESNLLAYSISKGGLMTLTRNLADAHGTRGIRINQFNIGWVLTPNEYALKIEEGLPPDWPERVPLHFAPAGRLFRPEEIAHFALSFVCDEAALVNGSIVDLDQYPRIGRNPAKTID